MNNIILTSKSEYLSEKLKKNTRSYRILLPQKNKDKKYVFPDGEIFVRVDEKKISKGRTVIVHTGSPDPNGGLVELEMILALLKNRNVRPEIFFTYFPYSLQDREFSQGELNAARSIVEKLIEYYSVRKIYALDAHFFGRKWTSKYPFENISAVRKFQAMIEKKYPDVTYYTPDAGSARRTKIKGFRKKRKNSFEITISAGKIDPKKMRGKIVAIVDDLIQTGGTLNKTCDELRIHEAEKIIVFATHAVLEGGIEKVKNACDEIYLTNSIHNKYSNIDIVDLLVDKIGA
jgi:ribose-phosphate pyrophosphokinase